MSLKLRIATLIERICRKLRVNPAWRARHLKEMRYLLYAHRKVNLAATLGFFSSYPSDEINLTALRQKVTTAQDILHAIRGEIAQPQDTDHTIPKVIWIYWNRGLAAAPDVVKLAYQSWQALNPGYEVRFLDDETIKHYFDAETLFRLASIDLTVAHKSDFIRTYLLATRGGVWADSTTFCWQPLDEWLPAETRDSGFFVFRQPDSSKDRQITNWFIASSRHNPITMKMVTALCDYLFKPREVMLSMRKARHYAHYPNISRTGTGYALLDAMEQKNFYPYFFYHYLFNEVVATGVEREAWQHVMAARNNHAKNHGEIGEAFVSKQTHKGRYTDSDTYKSRREMLLARIEAVDGRVARDTARRTHVTP